MRDVKLSRHAVSALGRLMPLRAVRHGDLLLPPARLRQGGAHFEDDRAFLAGGCRDVEKIDAAFGLGVSSSLLDVGCGVGRLPIGLLAKSLDVAEYVGIDVDRRSIKWCGRHLQAAQPRFRFEHLDVANARYNKRGARLSQSFRLPLEAGRFDVIYLYSVFSHMESGDVQVYLREFRRLLKPSGGVYLTAFLEEGVPDVEVNPPGYGPLSWEGPLHCVRYSVDFFREMTEDAGLAISRIDHGTETDGQTAVCLTPSRGT